MPMHLCKIFIVFRFTAYFPVSKLKNPYEVKIKVVFFGFVNSSSYLKIHPKKVLHSGSLRFGIGIS